MNILIVSATELEITPLLAQMKLDKTKSANLRSFSYKKMKIDVLVTGVGMTATAFYLGKTLNKNYDAAINLGLAGSFNRNLNIGDVVNVQHDIFSELGAEDGVKFLTLSDLKLSGVSEVMNENKINNAVIELIPKVTGITVNTVHGNEKSITEVFERFHPYVESMEGAAFMMACSNEKIPYAQIRAISNYVERRNKDAWNIPLAIDNLNKKAVEILESF